MQIDSFEIYMQSFVSPNTVASGTCEMFYKVTFLTGLESKLLIIQFFNDVYSTT
jgi:hypothetical protein